MSNKTNRHFAAQFGESYYNNLSTTQLPKKLYQPKASRNVG